MKQVFKSWLSDISGNMLMFAVVMVPVVFAAGVGAVSFNAYSKEGAYLQSAIDQAVLAAIITDDKARGRDKIAKEVLMSAYPYKYTSRRGVKKVTVVDFTEEFPPGEELTIKMTGKVKLENLFGTYELERTGTAERNVQNVEAVITMASSGTMCALKERTETDGDGNTLITLSPDPSCADFNSMKEGVKDFLESVHKNDTIGKFKLGLVPFNVKVKMPDLDKIPPTLSANEPEGYYSSVTDAEPLSEVLPLTKTTGKLKEMREIIDGLEQTEQGLAWSRTDIGTHVAALMLDPDHKEYFPGGEEPEEFGKKKTRKVVIIMGDGANIGCCYTNWPPGDFSNQYVYDYTPYNDAQLAICQALKAVDVEIFSILFNVEDTDIGGAVIDNVFARCASGGYAEYGVEEKDYNCRLKENCYPVKTTEDLATAYRQIAQAFYSPVITE
jgi:hypothetical protein